MLSVLKFSSQTTFNLGLQHFSGSSDDNPYHVTDNELFAEMVVGYPIGWKMDPFISGNFKTPITESFQYSNASRTRNGNLWDPVISQEAIGFTYAPVNQINFTAIRLGIALKQTRSHYNTQLTDDYQTPDIKETYKPESGIELVIEAGFAPDSTISYRGRIDLFGTFKTPDVWSVHSKNEFQIKVWKFFAILFGVYITQDVKQSLKTQYRQSIALGIIKNF